MDVLSYNLLNTTKDNENLQEDIQDCKLIQTDWTIEETIWTKKRSSKMGVILQQLKSQRLLNNLFMVEVGLSDNNEIHTDVGAIVVASTSGCIEKVDARQEVITQKQRRQEFWDVRPHWQLIDEVQLLVDGAKKSESFKTNSDWEHSKNMEIWDDEMCLVVLNRNQLPMIMMKWRNQGLASTYYTTIGIMTT